MNDKLLIPYYDDADFIRSNIPMTKALIRHESIRLLKLKPGCVMYDIGSGTGSIAIEAAALSETLNIYSIEKKPEAIALQNENINRFSAHNIIRIEGCAPEVLNGLPCPDAVFIGGSSGRLTDILNTLSASGKPIRVVVTAISLETISELNHLSERPDVSNMFIEQIGCSVVKPVGSYKLMQAENPVFLAAFDLNSGTLE